MMQLWSTDGIKAYVTIFDAVGHVVAQTDGFGNGENLVAELKTENRTRVVFYWNGRNSLNRKVGNGAYVAVVTVVDPNGIEVQERITLGIQ